MNRILELKIEEDMAEKSIKQILTGYYKMSTRFINRLKLTKGITLNGRVVNVTAIVQQDDIMMITMPIEFSENIVPTPMDIKIQYEDEDIMVVDKPPEMPVHPSQGNFSNTLANGVVYYWQQKEQIFMYRPVNRLDKGTSGLMTIAKNQYAHQQLADQIISKELKRKYIAVAHGYIHQDEGKIDLPIAREEGSTIKRMISAEGRQAVTYYKVVNRINHFTVVELTLKTGRTHQIRVHLSHMGYPLVGDWLYGKEEPELINRQALHSYYLEFTHPVSKIPMRFTSEIPEDMKKLVGNHINTMEQKE
ncbi:RluA family pseudouridine synthase [Petroclostridium sp. X23]|uniref:RluA family pseudouridine synthase n=1 Tax=Petroclostridium sp. X23 TaxID=3045146 RepID=UPI0024ADB4EF|nr:RluA family pseudouridine synthase [Petroclostridium sp. X23]WHH59376.1 RluA family pseudouridine synthase [Petroclostridium sp. X23]